MKTSRFCFAIAFAGLCVALAACDSEKPAVDPQKAKIDEQLLGVWKHTDERGNVRFFHVGRMDKKYPTGMIRVIPITHHAKNGRVSGGGNGLPAFAGTIGNDKYLNVAVADTKDVEKMNETGWDAKLVKCYTIGKYEVKDNTLTYWPMDDAAKRKAIEAGKIQGKIDVRKDSSFVPIYFTDTTENIAKFLADPANANLFEKKETYQRVK